MTGLTFARIGLAARLVFSTKRVGRRVNWAQSKRLLSGTLVALTPENDKFETICKIGIVAARPLSGLNQNPPEVDIFFGEASDIEIDPQKVWLMVESRHGKCFLSLALPCARTLIHAFPNRLL